MADLIIPIRNLVIEWRYPANLGLYSKMDGIGMHFGEAFPDWQRSPLTLEIRNRKSHRRFLMSHRRSFFDVIGQAAKDAIAEIDHANKLFDRLKTDTNITTIERIGMRQWAAFPKDEPFRDIAKRAKRKFQPEADRVEQCLRGSVDDVAYISDVTTSEGWKYRVQIGPMERNQWFALVPNERELFTSPEEFADYQKAFPERFLYFDIDCYKEALAPSDLSTWLHAARRISHDVLSDLHNYFCEG